MTARSYGREYDSRRTLRDFETIREVAERHASEKDLHVGIIQVLVEQYIHADPWQREKFTQSWLTRVMKRERRDFFPDAMHVALNIERM
jgi:hypothetical protein